MLKIRWRQLQRKTHNEVCPASMDAFVGEAVAASPERALGARFPLRVIDAFFVRTTNDAIRYDHGFCGVLSQKGENLLANSRVSANIRVLGEPALERIRIATLGPNNGNSEPACEICGLTIIPNRSGMTSG